MTKYQGILTLFSETGTEGGYWALQDEKFISEEGGGVGTWSYEGLHILKTGDTLVIYHKGDPSMVAWQGDVVLEDLGLFKEDAYGMWIHSDQKGQDREVWAMYFLEEWPAVLTTEEDH